MTGPVGDPTRQDITYAAGSGRLSNRARVLGSNKQTSINASSRPTRSTGFDLDGDGQTRRRCGLRGLERAPRRLVRRSR